MVYFVQSPDGGVIKIGTTVRLSERIKQLRAEVRADLEVLAVMDGDRTAEKVLHGRFNHLRLRPTPQCEWFEPGPDLVAFIREHGRDWDGSDEVPPVRLKFILAIPGTDEWGQWLEELAEENMSSVPATIDRALNELAQRLGLPRSPRRLPPRPRHPSVYFRR